ncbi:MAG: serine hydrolase [Myxococcales bacterium]|nr:serine hydrolase [Myxococcales bacterium]
MLNRTIDLGLVALAALCALFQEPVAPRFPASTAIAEGVSPEALARLDELVQGFVDSGDIVGAELLVIKNGRTILHEAHGLADRETNAPLQKDSVFCVRSMTKPVIGTAIMMLVEDDLLELDDAVAKFLPSFDVDGKREITVEQLLTHTSGLGFSSIASADLRALGDIRAVARLGAESELEFEPGTAFQYSDQGADTLTALVEVVTGQPAANFVQARILDPLGMTSSATVMTEDHPMRARALSKYAGSRGAWTRFWSPSDPPLFPFFLGSQGLYSSAEDYARFMDLWLNKGRVGKERLLRARSIRKALEPSEHPFPGSSGFADSRAAYGRTMQLWLKSTEEGDGEELVAFGHTGSDGTHAWAFPEEKALVLYFMQSRGTTTGLLVEEALDELFLGAPFDPNQLAPPLDEYLGYYWEGEGDLYRAIVRDGDGLALEIMGRGVVPLSYVGDDRWKLRPSPKDVIAFDRDEAGLVTGYHVGEHQEFRFEPSAELPSVQELQRRVNAAYHLDALEELGAARMTGTVRIDQLDVTGSVSAFLAWPDRYRVDGEMKGTFEHLSVVGEQVWYETSQEPLRQLEGEAAALLRADTPFVRYGDWHDRFGGAQVIQRMMDGESEIYLVRTGDASAPATTLYVDYETGRVRMADGLTFMSGLGRIGYRATFEDFREQSGFCLPFRTVTEIPNRMVGKIVVQYDELELGVELQPGTFALRTE